MDATQFPDIVDALDRLHFKSKAQSLYYKFINVNVHGIMYHVRRSHHRADKEQENVIIKDADLSTLVNYTKQYVPGAWPEAEYRFKDDPFIALWYSDHSGGKFKPGETAIATNAQASFLYATEYLKHRFLAGEEAIRKNLTLWHSYQKIFAKKKI
jgi:hypothetical protein